MRTRLFLWKIRGEISPNNRFNICLAALYSNATVSPEKEFNFFLKVVDEMTLEESIEW